jgi:hypothetical protein
VVIATGPATQSIVASFGYERAEVSLGRAANPGVIRAADDPLRRFFAATRRGLVPTLRLQAEDRGADLLWDPVGRARAIHDILDEIRPDHVIVDHLAFSARIALTAAAVPHADVVLGHPSALPVGDEVYGYPTAWPAAFDPDPSELAGLRRLCETVRDSFTTDWNAALHALTPSARPSTDAFAEHGDLLLYNYPAALHDPARTPRLPPHVFLGSAVRDDPVPADVREWLDGSDRPFVYVSFGSFLSERADVLATVMTALRSLDARVALATGTATDLPEAPPDWLVRPHLPQTALLARASAAVTHGGNNSVTEALTFGVPLVVLPFSTDQFAGAAAIEAAGLGVALDPNAASADQIAIGLFTVRGPMAVRAGALGEQLRGAPGPELARAALTAPAPAGPPGPPPTPGRP